MENLLRHPARIRQTISKNQHPEAGC